MRTLRQQPIERPRLKILLVKLSSLGDVVHTMPVVQDIRQALPQAQIDWVVERNFAPLVQRCVGVRRVIACDERRWRKAPFSALTRLEWRNFRAALHSESYDAVIDLQGLTKSALVAWLARLTAQGKRFALANRTEGSAYEVPTRWVADMAIRIDVHVHAVQRGRELCAKALGYPISAIEDYGLMGHPLVKAQARPCVALVHGTSRSDKLWPVDHWIELARRLHEAGCELALPHGSPLEELRSHELADAMPNATVWPRLDLGELTDALAGCVGVIGVDSGLSHIAVALNLPHVQVYNFDTAWRTGPQGHDYQRSVYANPSPSVDQVWQAWQSVSRS